MHSGICHIHQQDKYSENVYPAYFRQTKPVRAGYGGMYLQSQLLGKTKQDHVNPGVQSQAGQYGKISSLNKRIKNK